MNTLLEIIRVAALPAYGVFLVMAGLSGWMVGPKRVDGPGRAGFLRPLARGLARIRGYLANQDDAPSPASVFPHAAQ